MIELAFRLSWPLSTNERHSVMRKGPLAGRVFRNSCVDRYYVQVAKELLMQRVPCQSLDGSLELELDFHADSRRRFDLSNFVKSVEDALVKAKLIEDDSCFDRLVLERGARHETPCVDVVVRQLTAAAKQLEFGT